MLKIPSKNRASLTRDDYHKSHDLPVLLITGASGFIGQHLLASFLNNFYIYAFGRRPEVLCIVPDHKNIERIRLDIADEDLVKEAFDKIAENGGVDFIIHLAGFYDFSNKDDPEFERTNVRGTENILRHSAKLNPRRFIFASSITVTEFVDSDLTIDENSPGNADFPYARSKQKGEELVRSYSDKFPCTILRMAAIFSDWCEYGPLYMFISTWLGGGWKSRLLAGKGEAAIPYLHVEDVTRFLVRLMECSNQLSACEILIPSTEESTSHNELFEIAVKYFCRISTKPIHMPKLLASIGVHIRYYSLCPFKRPVFERPWMLKYIDKKMKVNTIVTRNKIDWQPTPRYHILRRMLFLIENMLSNSCFWHYRNKERLYKKNVDRPNIKIYIAMTQIEDRIVEASFKKIRSKEYSKKLKTYLKYTDNELKTRIAFLCYMLRNAILTGDRLRILEYAGNLANERFKEGFNAKEVCNAVDLAAITAIDFLLVVPELSDLGDRIKDGINMSNQLLKDEIEDTFERLSGFEYSLADTITTGNRSN